MAGIGKYCVVSARDCNVDQETVSASRTQTGRQVLARSAKQFMEVVNKRIL